MTAIGVELRLEVEAFLFREARLADESHYEAWLELFDEQAHYWVPVGAADYDPDTRISYVNDNRSRLETRVRQLMTGVRHAQSPPSAMRRLISNVEVLAVGDGPDGVASSGGTIDVGSNFVLHEYTSQAKAELRLWAGRTTHSLRHDGSDWRITRKVVELVNSSHSLPNLAFLI